ncbi:hypothetical protein MMRN_46460 [Mycobacterium marinum]|nr:hypothetical protein MMRN_46460 [Mycobacterium marinum]
MAPYDVGLLILRLVLGLTMAAHGFNKFFGGGRIPGTARWFESIGMKPGKFHATVAAITEVSAGLGLAAGLLTPIPAAGFVSLMFVAAWTVHRPNGFSSSKRAGSTTWCSPSAPSRWPRSVLEN